MDDYGSSSRNSLWRHSQKQAFIFSKAISSLLLSLRLLEKKNFNADGGNNKKYLCLGFIILESCILSSLTSGFRPSTKEKNLNFLDLLAQLQNYSCFSSHQLKNKTLAFSDDNSQILIILAIITFYSKESLSAS